MAWLAVCNLSIYLNADLLALRETTAVSSASLSRNWIAHPVPIAVICPS